MLTRRAEREFQRKRLRYLMNDIRIIKKYPNRRLYDTKISRYITLEEVRQLVIGGVKFRVEDKRTREDITRSIL
ncbi:polyhydroxyalkanoate synthesis regulator DNA-binding domain-containing protein, partial [Acinetobacter baumannii]